MNPRTCDAVTGTGHRPPLPCTRMAPFHPLAALLRPRLALTQTRYLRGLIRN